MTQDSQSTPVKSSGNRLFDALGLDFPLGENQPGLVRFIVATVVAVVASLAACAALAQLGVILFPSTKGYEHYGFGDYGKLTIIGVTLASLAWPVVTLLSTQARRLYFWLAVIVTLVGFAPDAWILYKGQPAGGVFILVLMHIALALITLPALVFIAPQRATRRRG
ncbi:DUF6069 family protein [Subtercola frigoramans]|uniref:DUF4267 domain-containing protein n=1 Tax=Subtercola frigoramans TaxID=120298 RepID=A0ABS2L133_9MICO|nr:DUF6069 family protein [Subtercola frigoramans]MBM7470778.1 hypothetical protein [Subtercola frigoramans]